MALSTLYNEATLSTERYFAPKVIDQLFKSNPFAMRLKANADMLDGGESIELPHLFAESPNGEWFSEWDTYDATHKEQLGAGRMPWSLYTIPVLLSNFQLLKNSGSETARFKLAKQKNIAAAKTAAHHLGQAVFDLDDTGLTNQMTSIDLAVSAGTTTYANITRATSGDGLLWSAQVDSSTTVITLDKMQELYSDCQEGDEAPNLIVTNKANFNRVWSQYLPTQRQGSEELGKLGFTSLLFNGRPLVVDSHCASVANSDAADYLYMFNMNYIRLVAHPMAFYTFMKSPMPSNQWIHIGRYFFMGQLVCDAPRYQGKMSAITS